MINKQLKFEAEIRNGSKVIAITRIHTKILKFKANFSLKVKVTFQTYLRYLLIIEQYKCKDKNQNRSI